MREAWNTEQVWQRWLDEDYENHPRPQQNVDAIANITFLTPENGGRVRSLRSDYRGQFFYEGHDWDARYTFASEPVEPGQTVEAIIQFLSPEAHIRRIHIGMAFILKEGSQIVGNGVITWI